MIAGRGGELETNGMAVPQALPHPVDVTTLPGDDDDDKEERRQHGDGVVEADDGDDDDDDEADW